MKGNYMLSAVGTAALAAAMVSLTYGQAPAGQAPAGQGTAQAPAGQASTPAAERKVVMVGENPEISKVDKEGGPEVSNFNFFRGFWTPAGAGAICVVTVKGQPNAADNFRIAIYDEQPFYDYMIKEIRKDYANATPIKGTITQTHTMGPDGLTRKETCKGGDYTIEAIWRGMQQATWTDMLMFQGTVQMSFAMIRAASGEITVNGKNAPGSIFTGGGRSNGRAYLTLNETWRR